MARAGRKTLFEDDVRAMLGMPKTEHAIEQGNVSLEKAFGHTKKGKQSKMNSVDSANEVEDANLSGAFGSRGSFCGSSRCVVGVGLVLLSVLAVVFTVEEMSSTSYSAKRLMGPATQHPRRGRGQGRGRDEIVSRSNWKTFQKQAEMESSQRQEMARETSQHKNAESGKFGGHFVKELEHHAYRRGWAAQNGGVHSGVAGAKGTQGTYGAGIYNW